MKNYGCELFNLTGTVGKVELISTFTTAVCESCNVIDKYTLDNAGDLREQSLRMLQTGAEEILLGYETIFENMFGYETKKNILNYKLFATTQVEE